MGSDAISYYLYNFNSRSLCGERWLLFQEVLLSAQFQFSLSVWGAICAGFPDRSHCNNFNSRSLCGERSIADASWFSKVVFQFLLPAWGAISRNSYCRCSSWFQFSLPAWGAIKDRLLVILHAIISILAPFVRSDMIDQLNLFEHWNFNSRSLPGER